MMTVDEIMTELKSYGSDNIKRIFSIDTISGQVIANPAFDQTLNWSGGLHVRSDAAVVGVTWNQALLQEEYDKLSLQIQHYYANRKQLLEQRKRKALARRSQTRAPQPVTAPFFCCLSDHHPGTCPMSLI